MSSTAELIARLRAHDVPPSPDGFYTMVVNPKAFMGLMDSEFQGFKYRRKAARLAHLASPTIARIYKP